MTTLPSGEQGPALRSAARRWMSLFAEIRGTAGANALIIGISFGASLLAARWLGPEHRGWLAAAVVYAALATAVGDAGLNQAVPYFAARHRDQAGAVLGTTTLLSVTLGVVAALGAYLVVSLDGGVASGALVYLLSVPFGMLTTHMAGYMYGGGMLDQFNVVRTLQAGVLLLSLVAAVLLGRADVLAVTAIAVGLSVVVAAGAVWTVGRGVPLRSWAVDARVGRRLLGYAVRSYAGNLCWLFNSRLDQLMMSLLLPAATLGIYATAVSYAGVVFSFFSAFAMLAFAKAAAVEPHEDGAVTAVIRRYLLLSLLLGVPVAFGLVVAAPWLFTLLFGVAFADGVKPAMVLSIAGIVLGLNYILSNALRIRNRPLLPSLAEAGGVVVSIVGLWWALPRFGPIGAAGVSLVSYATVLLTLVYFTWTHHPASPTAQPAEGVST